ncbi:MAG TPA: hypothetical protein VFS55_01430 [Dokdonella sp.]|nr:hypothetical protein [Dokdonella sp.]
MLAAYREYGWRSLRAEHSAAENEAQLLAALDALVVADGGTAAASIDAVEPLLARRIEAHGRHALLGQTLPLREFMLWSSETRQAYDVELPQARQAVTVVNGRLRKPRLGRFRKLRPHAQRRLDQA